MYLSESKGFARLSKKSKLIQTVTVIGLTFWVSPASAEPLNFHAARELAFDQAQIAGLFDNATAANRARLNAAAALPNPSGFLEHEALSGGGFRDHDETKVGVSTRLDFLWKRSARINSAERQGRIAGLSIEARRHRLAYQMAQLYLDHDYAVWDLSALQSSLDSLATARRVALARLERGDMPASDFRRLDLAIQQLEMGAIDIEARQAGTVAHIAALTGVPEVTPVGGLALEEPRFSTVTEAISAAHAGRPDLMQRQAYADWRAAEATRVSVEGRPEASLDLAYKRNSDNQSGAFVGISVEIPIFGGPRAQSRLARTEQIDAELEAEQASRALAGEVAEAFHRLKRLREMDRGETATAQHAAENTAYLRSITAAFEEGEATLLEYVDAVHTYAETVRGRLAFNHRLNLATLELTYLTAGDFFIQESN